MKDVAGQGRTVLFVSHNMGSIETLCSRGIVLQEGRLRFSGSAEEAVRNYLHDVRSNCATAGRDSAPGVLYDAPPDPARQATVVRVRLVDPGGGALDAVSTWSTFTLEVDCHAAEEIPNATLEIHFFSADDRLLANISTDQDLARPLTLAKGATRFGVTVRALPLSAGDYFLGVGIALRRARWLDYRRLVLDVRRADVYASGSAPTAERKPLALDYDLSASSTGGFHTLHSADGLSARGGAHA
jgi:lipopolysaccharide transport system ATP-binding protein